jgi:signal transduction histidine kinase
VGPQGQQQGLYNPGLVKAAKTYPDGSFVKYHYYLPEVHSLQEKLAYVTGIPDLECYIGTECICR